MRLIGQIQHPHLRIAIHEYNGKYLVEFEGGRCRQTYKFDKELYPLEAVQQWVSEVEPNIMERMHAMHEDLKKLLPKT
jgi:hypothetical protein